MQRAPEDVKVHGIKSLKDIPYLGTLRSANAYLVCLLLNSQALCSEL